MLGLALVLIGVYVVGGTLAKQKIKAGREPEISSGSQRPSSMQPYSPGSKPPSSAYEAEQWAKTAGSWWNLGKEVVSTFKGSKQSPDSSPQTSSQGAESFFGGSVGGALGKK